MKKEFMTRKMPLIVLVSGLVVTAAFAQTSSGKSSSKNTDTVPGRQKQIRDLDEALMEVDKGEAEMAKALKEVDFQKMEQQIRNAMKQIDVEKMKLDVDVSLRNMDMAKMEKEIAQSLKDINMEKLSVEVNNELKRVNMEAIRADVQRSLSSIDSKKLQSEINRISEVEMPRLKEEIKNLRPQIEKQMQQAKKELAAAKSRLQNWKDFLNVLEKDGLINQKNNYKIEYKDGELSINGEKQSSATTKKYSTYLKENKNFTIEKTADNFSINDDKEQ